MSNKPSNGKKSILRLEGLSCRTLFVGAIGISAFISILFFAIMGDGKFRDSFFIGGGDFFMDFFNSIRDASQGKGVYSERGVIYPPMANLIFLLLSRFTPSTYNNTSFSRRESWIYYDSCLLLVFVTLVICSILVMATIIRTSKGTSQKGKLILSSAALLSLPFLYLLERGNIILLCIIALLIYAFTYDSESKIKRELGLIALAFAFSVKLYPVIFGWFLIADKRYKDAIRCALYGLALLVLPSFFFGGPIFCLQSCINNIFGFSSGSGNTITKVMNYFKFPQGVMSLVNLLSYAWVLICGVGFAISPFIRKEQIWKTWMLGLVTILCIPSLTGIYSWTFFLIPLIFLFNDEEKNKKLTLGAILMIIPFIHIPIRFSLHVSATNILVYLVTAALSIYAVIDLAKDLFRFLRDRKTGLVKEKA